MSTRTGFPRMDWDTGFLADPKFQHLRELLPDPIRFGYAGFCYLRLAADAWRTCERHPVEAVVRGIEDWAVTALFTAELLDDGHRLLEGSFGKWVGSALEARVVWKDRQHKSRESRGLTVRHGESRDVTVTDGESPPARAIGRNGREESVGQDEGVQGEDAVFVFLAQHGAAIRPDSPLGRRLYGLMDRRGSDVVLKEATEMAKVENVMSDRQWVLGLEHGLEAIPSGRKSVDDAVTEELQARSEGIYARMVERRLEYFRQTGRWDPTWGERPAA